MLVLNQLINLVKHGRHLIISFKKLPIFNNYCGKQIFQMLRFTYIVSNKVEVVKIHNNQVPN